jgi:hypothetical protein
VQQDQGGVKRVQKVVGKLLFYGRAVDNTLHVALGSLASQQNEPTERTMADLRQLLDYCASNPNAVVRYHASDMTLHIHSDASYLSEKNARSRAGGYFYLSSKPQDPTKAPSADAPLPPMNGAIHVLSSIMKNVLASAAESETGALFWCCQDAVPIRTCLIEMGHPQDATQIVTDNVCASGIVNGTVKQRRSKAIDMRFYWVRDRIKQGQFIVYWRRGAINLADYFTKHHPPAHHKIMRHKYLQAMKTMANHLCLLRGCTDAPK